MVSEKLQLDQWGAVEPEGPENSFLKETGIASVVQSDQRDGMDQIGAPHFFCKRFAPSNSFNNVSFVAVNKYDLISSSAMFAIM